jgi:O-acetyl-ADP-ribose deacetylase (regulator of RNase III)
LATEDRARGADVIRYVCGDATRPNGTGPKVLCHICNDRGGWGKGFVLAVSKRWPEPEQVYRHRLQYDLGTVQFVLVEPDLTVANMTAQHGYRATKAGPPIRYDALRECLAIVGHRARARDESVHMPRIGTGLAGGSWDRVELIIRDTLVAIGVNVTVYNWSKL